MKKKYQTFLNNHIPIIKQYFSLKLNYPDMLFFFQIGDFYELFYEDAIRISDLLNITLTKKGYSNKKIIPMAGIPCHRSEYYILKLIKLGESIVLCNQVEDEDFNQSLLNSNNNLINRQVVKVITPGVITDEAFLNSNEDNIISSVWKEKNIFCYSILDMCSGFFSVSKHLNIDCLLSEIERTNPKELLYPENYLDFSSILHRKCMRKRPLSDFDLENSYKILNIQFQTCSLKRFGIEKDNFIIRAAGSLLQYVKLINISFLPHIRSLKVNNIHKKILMNVNTRKSLEITHNILGGTKFTLSSVLNKTITSMGTRLLNRWLNAPLRDYKIINCRQKSIQALQICYKELQLILRHVSDLERIISRIFLRNATPRDFIRMCSTLKIFPKLTFLLKNVDVLHIKKLCTAIGNFNDIVNLLDRSISLTSSTSIQDGNIISSGYNQNLDELRKIKKNSQEYIKNIEIIEKRKLKIESLKINFNKIIGYYIQISKRDIDLIPDYYIRIQTLKHAERYTIPCLKEYEKKILGIKSEILFLEKKLYFELFDKITPFLVLLKKSAKALSELDVLSNLSERSVTLNYVCPKMNEKNGLILVESRHPVVEYFLKKPFVKNSVFLSKKEKMLIITGPNMGGKSTYIRQVGLIVIMAYIGSFVPAKYAYVGIVDKIFTRIGSADNLAQGYSTFMMEMNEMSYILNNATCFSLVLIDELGRGTSTNEGLSLSWSCAKYLLNKIKSMTLISTHFIELTKLSGEYKKIKNLCFTAIEENCNIEFLYKIKKGVSQNSCGILVASLSKLPKTVIQDAQKKLIMLN